MVPRHGHNSLPCINGIDYHTRIADPYCRNPKAKSKIRALLPPITITTNPSPFAAKAYDLYAVLRVEKEVHMFVDVQIESAAQIGFRVANVEAILEIEDLEAVSETRNYACRFIAVSQHNQQFARELQGLLLGPLEEEHCLRRAGVIPFEGRVASQCDTTRKRAYISKTKFGDSSGSRRHQLGLKVR